MKTKPSIPEQLIERFAHFLDQLMGLHYKRENWEQFLDKFLPAVSDFGFDNPASCMEWLMNTNLSEDQVAILAHYLTVGETYFFRDSNTFKALHETVLPAIIDAKSKEKKIRIWSAACCTGEEPYSIAMLLDSMLPASEKWQITILATDINSTFLHLAKEGLFREWSFRTTPENIKKRYFSKTDDGKYQISQDIIKTVQFKSLNLVKDAYPSLLNGTNAMDLILCSNVLIYFKPQTIDTVIEKIGHSLVDSGWLIVSPVEVPYVNSPDLKFAGIDKSAIFQKKTDIDAQKKLSHFETVQAEEQPLHYQESDEVEHREEASTPYAIAVETYEKGDYEKAIELLKSKPETTESCILISKCYGNMGQLEKALTWCKQAIEKDKVAASYYYLQATIEQELDRNAEAIESLKKSLYLDSRFIIGHITLGNLLRQNNHKEQAKKHYRNALQLLEGCSDEEQIPCAEGLTAGRLREFIQTMQGDGHG